MCPHSDLDELIAYRKQNPETLPYNGIKHESKVWWWRHPGFLVGSGPQDHHVCAYVTQPRTGPCEGHEVRWESSSLAE